MKIALIKQRTGYNLPYNRDKYKDKIEAVLGETNADIIVGPELAIANGVELMNYSQLCSFCDVITKNIQHQLIIPGTALVFSEKNKSLRNIAPILMKNKRHFLSKKSSVSEERIADDYGLEYKTDPDNKGFFNYENLVIAVEICRDHGMGKLNASTDQKADIEFILACTLAGFCPSKAVIKNNGIIAVDDGSKSFGAEVYVCRKEGDNYNFIEGKETDNFFLIENGR